MIALSASRGTRRIWSSGSSAGCRRLLAVDNHRSLGVHRLFVALLLPRILNVKVHDAEARAERRVPHQR